MIPISRWLLPETDPEQAADLFAAHASPDMHANLAVFLCASVCELIAERTQFVELDEPNGCDAGAFTQRWTVLWHQLQRWIHDRPAEILPNQTIQSQPFPQILYMHPAAISSNQLYHTACILLLGSRPPEVDLEPGQTNSAIWHAKSICGISLTNPHPGCLNNAIQPLWIAGRLLSHESEHVLVAKLIRSIESMTGWATTWRIADLEADWGHKIPAS